MDESYADFEPDSIAVSAQRQVRAPRRTHADPHAPRKPPTAFMAYSNDHRNGLVAKHPDQANNVKAIASMLGQMWRSLPEEDKQRYKDGYTRKKHEYDDALREYYTANPDAKERDDAMKRVKKQTAAQKRSRGHGASGGPKRALTPFFCFVQKFRAAVKAESPEAKPTEVTVKLAELWRGLCTEEKREFNEEAAKDRQRYLKECVDQGVEPSSVKRARRLAGRDAVAEGPDGLAAHSAGVDDDVDDLDHLHDGDDEDEDGDE